MSDRSVSVVIPTYNGLLLLKKNLPTVLACMRTTDELVIVDDASTDDTIHWLETDMWSELDRLSHFQIIKNAQNLRFGASVNKAVQHAKHSLVFLVNNDVSPHPDVLTHLIPHFSDPDVFAVGCLEQEKSTQSIGGKNRLWFEKGLFMHVRATEFNSGPTAWASGGSAMYDREKWLQLGGFDKAYYPAYWEDIDLSFRAKKRGWQVLFEPNAVVDHNHESTNADVFGQQKIAAMSWRNAHRFVWRNGSTWQKIANLIWRPYWFIQQQRVSSK